MEKSTKKKWLWGIGIFIVLAAIGNMQEKKEGGETKTPKQTEQVVEQSQETEAESQRSEKKEEVAVEKKKRVF